MKQNDGDYPSALTDEHPLLDQDQTQHAVPPLSQLQLVLPTQMYPGSEAPGGTARPFRAGSQREALHRPHHRSRGERLHHREDYLIFRDPSPSHQIVTGREPNSTTTEPPPPPPPVVMTTDQPPRSTGWGRVREQLQREKSGELDDTKKPNFHLFPTIKGFSNGVCYIKSSQHTKPNLYIPFSL
eukprot:sb/3471496/